MHMSKVGIISIIVGVISICFGFFCDAAVVNTKKVDARCNNNYATKKIAYSEFNSSWFIKKGKVFCAAGVVDYQSLECVVGQGNTNRCKYLCDGEGGGKKASCYFDLEKEDLCGVGAGVAYSNIPEKNLCISGAIASIVEDRKKTWNWTCKKYNGLLVSYCSTVKSCFQKGDIVSVGQSCCEGLVFCPTNDTSTVGYCSDKCVGECSTAYEPVCGKDGRDYNNDCMARRAGTETDFEGECKTGGVKCGIASEKSGYSLEDSANLCKYGKPSVVSGSGPWSWLCQSEKGNIISCNSYKTGAVTGVCGSSNMKTLKQIPTTGLCSKGSASIIKGDVVWRWTCGSSGGVLVNCYAAREGFKADGVCAVPSRYSSGAIDESNLCREGMPSMVIHMDGFWTWECKGVNGGKNASCKEKLIFNSMVEPRMNGTCGSVNGTQVGEEPNRNLCAEGKIKGFYFDYAKNEWVWNCAGSGGGIVSKCKAYYSSDLVKTNGQCGLAASEPTETVPVMGLCEKGVATEVSGNGPWSWMCKGVSGGKDVRCSATRPVAKKGICGSAIRREHSSIPVNELCSSGLASSVSGEGPWYWTCSGMNGGEEIQCSARLSKELIPREETDKYMLLDFWIDDKMRKGIRVSLKDYGVNVFMAASTNPYRAGIGPEKKGDYDLTKITPADGWTDAYFYQLPEDNRKEIFCFDAWYVIDWQEGKLSPRSQFYSKCIKLSPGNFSAPESISIRKYPVLQGAIVVSLWGDGKEVKNKDVGYSTIMVRRKGVIPLVPEKETTIAESVIGKCNNTASCPKFDLILGDGNKRIIAYLPKGNYCYSAWTRYCNGYFCNNSTNTSYWCFEI